MLDIVNTLLKDKYVPKDTHSPIARFSTSHEHHLDRIVITRDGDIHSILFLSIILPHSIESMGRVPQRSPLALVQGTDFDPKIMLPSK